MTKCAICKQKGGRFRYRPEQDDYVHAGRCVPEGKSRNGMHANWPLVTAHVGGPNDGPMTINNLSHLRRVERDYGVASEAYNYDRGNRQE